MICKSSKIKRIDKIKIMVLLMFRTSLQIYMPLLFTLHPDTNTQIAVWHCLEPVDEMKALVHLDSKSEEMFVSMKNTTRKRQWLGCRVALSLMLNKKHVEIHYNGFGKPEMKGASYHLSFSHSGDYSAVIISKTSCVGIDLELYREKIVRVADRFLVTQEEQIIKNEERLTGLLLFWTAKEALYKIQGDPDVDIRSDIRIESINYLCSGSGEMKSQIKWQGKHKQIPVYFRIKDDFILSWAQMPC